MSVYTVKKMSDTPLYRNNEKKNLIKKTLFRQSGDYTGINGIDYWYAVGNSIHIVHRSRLDSNEKVL